MDNGYKQKSELKLWQVLEKKHEDKIDIGVKIKNRINSYPEIINYFPSQEGLGVG